MKSAGDWEKEAMKRSESPRACVVGTNHSWKQSVKRWMNVGVELSVNVTGLQNAFRLCSLCSCLLLHSHELFVWHYLHFLASLYPMFITNVGVCMSVSCIYWLGFCDVYVCLHLCKGVISMWLCACCLSSFHCCRLLLSSCCSAVIETLVAQPLLPRYHTSCSRFPQWLRTGPLSSSCIISSLCRLQAVVQQLDSEANERVTFTCFSIRNRDLSFDLIHVWIHLCILKRTSCLLTSAQTSLQYNMQLGCICALLWACCMCCFAQWNQLRPALV